MRGAHINPKYPKYPSVASLTADNGRRSDAGPDRIAGVQRLGRASGSLLNAKGPEVRTFSDRAGEARCGARRPDIAPRRLVSEAHGGEGVLLDPVGAGPAHVMSPSLLVKQ